MEGGPTGFRAFLLLSPDIWWALGGRREGRVPCVWPPAPLPEVQTPVADAGLTLWFVESLNRSDDESQGNRGALR